MGNDARLADGHVRGRARTGRGTGAGSRPDDVIVQVIACGLCRTDLHVIDQEIPVHRTAWSPAIRRSAGSRGSAPMSTRRRSAIWWASRGCAVPAVRAIGVARARRTCARLGVHRLGRRRRFRRVLAAPAAFVYRLRPMPPVTTAPLLCAGIIGFRALRRANLPAGRPTRPLRVRLQRPPRRADRDRLGRRGLRDDARRAEPRARPGTRCRICGREAAPPPEPLDSAIVFAPAGALVPVALAATRSGGTVVLAGIEMSDIPSMSYEASLFRERDLRTVTANTRDDGRRLLELAANLGLRPAVTTVPFESLDSAIGDIRDGRARGSLVLLVEDRDASVMLDPRDFLPHLRHPVGRVWRDRKLEDEMHDDSGGLGRHQHRGDGTRVGDHTSRAAAERHAEAHPRARRR